MLELGTRVGCFLEIFVVAMDKQVDDLRIEASGLGVFALQRILDVSGKALCGVSIPDRDGAWRRQLLVEGDGPHGMLFTKYCCPQRAVFLGITESHPDVMFAGMLKCLPGCFAKTLALFQSAHYIVPEPGCRCVGCHICIAESKGFSISIRGVEDRDLLLILLHGLMGKQILRAIAQNRGSRHELAMTANQ